MKMHTLNVALLILNLAVATVLCRQLQIEHEKTAAVETLQRSEVRTINKLREALKIIDRPEGYEQFDFDKH